MALVDEYNAAVARGDTAAANYLAQALAASAGIDINANTVTAASPAQLGLTQKSATPPGTALSPGAFDWPGLDNFIAGVDKAFPLLGKLDAAAGAPQPEPTPGSFGSKISGIGSAIAFITDVPRVITTLLGFILIIAGIFALTRMSPTLQLITDGRLGSLEAGA